MPVEVPPELRDPKTLVELSAAYAAISHHLDGIGNIYADKARLVQLISTLSMRAVKAEQEALRLKAQAQELRKFEPQARDLVTLLKASRLSVFLPMPDGHTHYITFTNGGVDQLPSCLEAYRRMVKAQEEIHNGYEDDDN